MTSLNVCLYMCEKKTFEIIIDNNATGRRINRYFVIMTANFMISVSISSIRNHYVLRIRHTTIFEICDFIFAYFIRVGAHKLHKLHKPCIFCLKEKNELGKAVGHTCVLVKYDCVYNILATHLV